MRAWRSDSGARTASSLRTPRRFLLALLALLIAGLAPAPEALAAPAKTAVTKSAPRPPADT
ncbi:MAG TPA: hypothetical protein VFT93_02080, partial [Candidatus Eisenbacteria bacterium]|nr:hypothetical protein [Candidatus Eisenbacteria bacterium]